MPPTLALVHDLAAAIVARDPDATFDACAALAEIIGTPAAVALARALAVEADADEPPPRVLLRVRPGLASCA